jgi:D-alanyl-D-alanine carboxypeptidase
MNRTMWVCASFLLAACLLSGQGPAALPAAEQQARAWLAAFNSGDRDALLEFLQKNRPSGVERIDYTMVFRARTGGFLFIKTLESAPTHFAAYLKEKDSDVFAKMEVEVDPAPPHLITKFELQQVPRPEEFAITRVSEGEAIKLLAAELQARTAVDAFSGAALVAKDGKILFSRAYGLANREKKIPNRLDTQFRLGSMNKMFTAVGILQLVQAGKIELTAPFGNYLTDYANKDVSSRVTIHQLLTHTGGTGDIFGPEFEAHRLELRSLQDYVKLYEKRGLEFAPGSRWEYSNYGFILLGALIEKVSGEPYYDYVREHVFKPAGMKSSDSLPESEAVQNRSVGYMKEGFGPWQPNTDTLPYRGTSAGGGYSTVEDLSRFAAALVGHKLLDAEHTSVLVSGKVDTPRGEKYAYGFFEREESGVVCFGHGGGAPGMNGDLKICPVSGYVIVVLANLDPPAAERVSSFVTARLPAK